MQYDYKRTTLPEQPAWPPKPLPLGHESDIVHQLDSLAGALDRSRNYLVNQALREYLKTHAWQVEKITQGIAAADRGEVIAHDEVMKEIEAIAQPVSCDNFFDCAGIWEDREIDQTAIRAKAWPDQHE